MGKIVGMRREVLFLGLLTAVMITLLSEVEGRRWGNKMADAMMGPWEKVMRRAKGPSYKYWHHKKDSSGRWKRRKYGRSDSGSDSESRSDSSSGEGKRRKSYRHRSHSRSSASAETKARWSAYYEGNDERTFVPESLLTFVEAQGCENVTALQIFLASYNVEVKPALSFQSLVLKEISKMAQSDLDRGVVAEDVCLSSCSQEDPKPRATTD